MSTYESHITMNRTCKSLRDGLLAITVGITIAQTALASSFQENLTLCDKGDAEGCFNLGYMYAEGKVVAKDGKKAVQYFDKACNRGDALGCFNLGAMYDEGEGVAKDEKKAVEYYDKACNGGDAGGCLNVGVSYGKGEGVAKDEKKALQYADKACKGGVTQGCDLAERLRKRLR